MLRSLTSFVADRLVVLFLLYAAYTALAPHLQSASTPFVEKLKPLTGPYEAIIRALQ